METMERVIAIIRQNTVNSLELEPDTNLLNDLGIDSFDRLMIVNSIEDEFSIEFDEDDFQGIKKVSDIVKILKEKYLNPDNPG